MSITGSCLCKNITITIIPPASDANYTGHLCHCANCRTWGGSQLASIIKLPLSSVSIQGSEHLATYHDSDTVSGNAIERKFCRECGSSLLKVTPRSPDSVDVHIGLFKDIPKPTFEGFCSRRQDWERSVQWPVQVKWEELPGGAKAQEQ